MQAADARSIVCSARAKGQRTLDEPAAKTVLGCFGIATPARRVVRSAEELSGSSLRAPFALKAVSSEILHKSDVGAVRVGLRDLSEAAKALGEMRASLEAKGLAVSSWLVEEMARPGVECVIGGVVDRDFGPMVMVGLGGIFVEIMRDVSFRICPIEPHEAVEMLQELRGAPLLQGARGTAGMSMDAIVRTLLSIGGEHGLLMTLAEEVTELDINPLIVTTESAVAVDARIALAPAASGATA